MPYLPSLQSLARRGWSRLDDLAFRGLRERGYRGRRNGGERKRRCPGQRWSRFGRFYLLGRRQWNGRNHWHRRNVRHRRRAGYRRRGSRRRLGHRRTGGGGASGSAGGARRGSGRWNDRQRDVRGGTAQSSDVTINVSSLQQKITGFGVSSAWAGSYANASDPDYLWSTTKGAGLTLLRIRYGDGLAIAKRPLRMASRCG